MKRVLLIVASLLIGSVVFSAGAYAQSNVIYFPYVINDSQTSTEVILTNVTGRDATATLAAYREDGTATPISSVSVPANAQIIIGPDASFRGWAIVSTDVAGVLGHLRVSSPSRAAQDTTDSGQVGTTLIFPLAAQSAGASTEIAVVNPTANAARVGLTVYDKSGGVVATAETAIAGFGMLRGSVAAIFGVNRNYSAASHVVARFLPGSILSGVSEIAGVGFEIVRGFVQSDPSQERISPRSDWAAFTAVPVSSAANAFTFPNVNRGNDWFSLIGVVNGSDAAQTVTLTYSTSTNPNAGSRNLSIAANGSLRMTATDLFGPGQDSGFVKISTSGNVASFMALGTLSGLAIGAAQGQAAGLTEFFLPGVDETGSSFTGIALLNDGSQPATVDFFLITPKGETIGLATEVLGPGQRVVKDLTEDIGQAFNTKGGYVFFRSTAPVFGMAVAGVADRTLNQLSARATVPGFVPPPLQITQATSRLKITGTVRDFGTGTPAAGVTVTLSRDATADVVTTTDASGAYSFSGLAPGIYTLTPTQSGRAFIPPNATVQISGSSIVVDFTRDTLPVIRAITVITSETGPQRTAGNNPSPFAIFGTAEVTLRIDGLNFARPGQKVFFGSRAIPTENVNFVDSQTIFVRLILNSPDILAELAAKSFYGSYDITIAGQPPFDTTRSNAFPFYILPPVPVLTGVTPSQTFARYEINSSGQQLTITGFGFREGARLLFDGGTAVNGIEIDTTFVSSTQLRAFLPPQALRFGGVYLLRVRNVSQLPEVSGEAFTFQVNNLQPQISSLNPPGPLNIIGPGPTPVSINMGVNGSNFFPKTEVAIALRIPDQGPALVPVNGSEQCVIANHQAVLRVRVLDASGNPTPGVSVTFTAPGINTNLAGGVFLPAFIETVTVTSDALGFAPPMSDQTTLFQPNSILGNYVVTAAADLGGVPVTAVFNITNVKPGEACVSGSGVSLTLVSSNHLIVNQFAINSRGTYGVFAVNPSPGGGVSNEVLFEVGSGPASNVPTIRSVDSLFPASIRAGSPGFNLIVFRDTTTTVPFQADAWVNFGTVRLNRIPVSTSSDSLEVNVPAFLIASPGTVPVTVTNPGADGSTGGTSTRVFFTVTP